MSRTGEILLAHGEAYRGLHGSRMTPEQLRAMRALAACHTPALGGVRWQCPRCGGAAFAWRSCGNRHCPACGHADAKLWLERQTRLLLPGVTYHLATFTVPDALRRTVLANPREALPILFEASSSALLDLCRDPRRLGGTPALTAVLHTWTRQMLYHPHVHFIASGGGLAPDGSWREAGPKFLVPVRALSALFAARFRVALADSAILSHGESEVIFRYRDGPTGKARTARVAPHEFIRRLLLHVLPQGFRKVRHYGLHHSSKRAALRLAQARLALARELPLPPAGRPVREPMPAPVCRHCDTQMQAVERHRPAPARFPHSTARGPPTA